MGMATILFNRAEPFKQIVNTLFTEGPMWNMEKIAQAVSEKKIFKDNSIFTCMYIAQRQGLIRPQGKNIWLIKKFYFFN